MHTYILGTHPSSIHPSFHGPKLAHFTKIEASHRVCLPSREATRLWKIFQDPGKEEAWPLPVQEAQRGWSRKQENILSTAAGMGFQSLAPLVAVWPHHVTKLSWPSLTRGRRCTTPQESCLSHSALPRWWGSVRLLEHLGGQYSSKN